MYNFLSIVSLLLSCYFILRLLMLSGAADIALSFFNIAVAHIAIWGYLLSFFNLLGNMTYWAVSGLASAAVSATAFFILEKKIAQSPSVTPPGVPHIVLSLGKEITGWERLVLMPLLITVISLAAVNLATIFLCPPHNWDSMTYHLARMSYYLQHNNFDYFPADYWPQVVHPKNSSLLLIYSYLASGRNENLTQLVQFISYWVSVCSIYGIARRIGNRRSHSLFAALVSALLITWLLESTTTQNDMIITAFFGGTIYFLFSFRDTQQRKYLGLAALGTGLAIGTKATALVVLPAMLFVGLFVLFRGQTFNKKARNLGYFSAAVSLAICIFALPAGYLENYRVFHNPIGSEQIREHSFKGKSLEYVLRNGAKNVVRFGFDFLVLDGLPPVDSVKTAQAFVTALPKALVTGLGIDLEAGGDVREPFHYEKPYFAFANEDWCYWGVFGFGLIWIVVMLSIMGAVQSHDAKILSFAALIFLFSQAFAGYYFPQQARYFATCAIFAAPVTGVVLSFRSKYIRAYLIVVVLTGCLAAGSAVMLRPNRTPIAINFRGIHRKSVFELDRIAQLTTNNPVAYKPLEAFEELVPKDATVAISLAPDSFEYPLFGEKLTRTVIPITPFAQGRQRIPGNADYLLYSQKALNLQRCSDPDDLFLGDDWCLRFIGHARRKGGHS